MNNYRRNEMTLYILAETGYVERENSRAFPLVTRNRLPPGSTSLKAPTISALFELHVNLSVHLRPETPLEIKRLEANSRPGPVKKSHQKFRY